ncbi:MAG: hypothetical protein EOO38_26145 [Cytophagaceae bacterium]|nr:MAG: hypothetical protein EOO38_26145 [Cytophagaceae bacterium]
MKGRRVLAAPPAGPPASRRRDAAAPSGRGAFSHTRGRLPREGSYEDLSVGAIAKEHQDSHEDIKPIARYGKGTPVELLRGMLKRGANRSYLSRQI